MITMEMFCGAIQKACVPHAYRDDLGADHEAVWSMNDTLVCNARLIHVRVPANKKELFACIQQKLDEKLLSPRDEATVRDGLRAIQNLLTEVPDFTTATPHEVIRRRI